MLRLHTILPQAGWLALLLPALAAAGEPVPEIQRPPAPPQAVGVLHTLRTIPEACTRLQGRFTGDPAAPYRLEAVPSAARCPRRAVWSEPLPAAPSAAAGWRLNDVIRVPNAACPQQVAVVQVWRRDGAGSAPPARDAQGRARVYLQERMQAAAAGRLPALPQFSARLQVEGRCGGGAGG